MADKPTRETRERHHNLGKQPIHLPRDSRSGSDLRAQSTRKPATQNDMPSGVTNPERRGDADDA